MKKTILIALLAAAGALPAGAYDLPPSTGTHRVSFDSDFAKFNEYTIVSPSDFVMDDDTGTVYGKSGTMDYGAETGLIHEGRFAYKNFIIKGRVVEFDKVKYTYKKASITSCDDEPAHYRLRASRLYMVPDSYFLAYNTVFFVGKLPVFYFPVVYRPLGGGTPFVSVFRPG